jgi:putative nucleotidyltransferase with HDIG domain
MRLKDIRTRIPSIENVMSLRKQTLIVIGVSVSVVVLNQLEIPRAFMNEGMESISYFTLSITIGAAMIGGLTILLLEKSILSRICKFSREVKSISQRRDFSARIDLKGRDEIAQLAASVNDMLLELEQAHGELERSNSILKYYQQHLEDKVQEQVNEIRRLFLGGIESLVFALEAKDKYTAGHSRRVAKISVAIGKYYGLCGDELDNLRWGALLHDVGKIAIEPAIQNKSSKLTDEEYRHIMIHAEKGAEIVSPVANEVIVDIIRHHHSRYDGRGLDQTEMRSSIPLGARIVAVADTFDAMTSDRPYRSAIPIGEAVKEIIRCNCTQFDPEIVKAFLNIYSLIPIHMSREVALV